jgi:hypothetical protein
MKQDYDFFKTTMPKSRKADYYLGCFDSAVFIDFNQSNDNLIFLCRISFDGYGCCSVDPSSNHLNHEDSKKFIEEMVNEKLDQEKMTLLVKEIIKINKEHLWKEAIEEYGLIDKDKL